MVFRNRNTFEDDIDKYMNDNIKIQKYIVKELKNNTYIKIPKDLPLYNHNIIHQSLVNID